MHWLLNSDAGWWVGSVLIAAGIIALGALLVWRYGGVRMGPDPVIAAPKTEVLPIVPRRSVEPNWVPLADAFPLSDTVDLSPQLSAVARYFERTETTVTVVREVVVERAVDPLDVTVEIEAVDPSVPLFYEIKPPAPFELESFTGAITRAQIERAKAGGAR